MIIFSLIEGKLVIYKLILFNINTLTKIICNDQYPKIRLSK